MNTIWNELKLQDSISYYIGGGWGEDDYKEELKPAFVIRGTDMPYIRDGYYNEIPFRFHKVSNISKRILEENDIILEVSGGSKDQLVGRSIIVKKDLLNFLSPSAICASFCKLIRPDKNVVFPKFLYMWLRTIYSNGEIGKYQIQSTGISNFQFEAFIKHAKIQLPDLPTQKRIAEILSAYDDLIENNNRRIALLEKAAQELYKEWFVRFRFPGYENAKFENGLPEGWTIKRMNDFCYVTDGTHDTPKPLDEGFPLITGRCIKNGFVDFDEAYCISEKDHESIKKRSGLSSGDILFSNIGTVGNCCIVDYNREFSVKNVIVFKPNDMIQTAYLYYWMTSHSMQEIFATQTNGASQQFVGLTFMRRYKILVPEQKILSAFGDKILPILEQKRMLHNNNLNLAKQRDLLLPRLMSGQLEV